MRGIFLLLLLFTFFASFYAKDCLIYLRDYNGDLNYAHQQNLDCDNLAIQLDFISPTFTYFNLTGNTVTSLSLYGGNATNLSFGFYFFRQVQIFETNFSNFNSSAIVLWKVNSVTIHGCEFSGSAPNTLSIPIRAEFARVSVENCIFTRNFGGIIMGKTDLKISSLSVRNSVFSNLYGYPALLGIFSNRVKVENCTFVDSEAGAIRIISVALPDTTRGSLYVNNSVFEDNGVLDLGISQSISNPCYPANFGAAICVEGPLQLYNSVFNNNSAIDGGAIFALISLTTNNVISNGNYAKRNGGFLSFAGFNPRFNISNVESYNDEASEKGGFIYSAGAQTAGYSLNQVSITNAKSKQGGGFFFSGVSSATHFDLMMTRVSIFNNSASSGGAVYVDQGGIAGSIFVQNCSFVNNSAQLGSGGAMFLGDTSSFISITGSDFIENEAVRDGGAIQLNSELSMSRIVVEDVYSCNNSAGSNGGMLSLSGSFSVISIGKITSEGDWTIVNGGSISIFSFAQEITIRDSSFRGNHAGFQGGGFSLQSSTVDRILIEGIFVSNNRASYGGAFSISAEIENLFVSDCLLEKSSAFEGGAMYIDGTYRAITNVSIDLTHFQNNDASYRGSALSVKGSVSHLVATNCLIANNTANDATVNLEGSIDSFYFFKDVFQFNSVVKSGGGMKIMTVPVTVEECKFISNQAMDGGGIYYLPPPRIKRQEKERLQVLDSEFTNNKAIVSGGGMYIAGDALVSGDSIQDNLATSGSAIYVKDSTLEIVSSPSGESSVVLSGSAFLNTPDADTSNVVCETGRELNQMNGSFTCLDLPATNDPNRIMYVGVAKRIIIGAVVGSVALLIIIVAVFVFVTLRQRKRARRRKLKFNMVDFKELNLGAAKKSLLNFDEFKNVREVGSGNFGLVYKAEWRELDVAIKQIKSDNVTKDQMIEFLREVAILQNLRAHPNVVLFLGITFPPQPLSLVTEFCGGGNLYDYLRKHSTSKEQKLEFIKGIAKGMLHLHAENIIHRDLAVRNILLTKFLEPKVSDFGLSREESVPREARVTVTETGPLKWMAPESMTRREYSTKSDVFSFGVTVWEILTVQDPFASLTPVEAALEVTKGVRLPITSAIDPYFAKLLHECWYENPTDRPDFEEIFAYLDPTSMSTYRTEYPSVPPHEQQLHNSETEQTVYTDIRPPPQRYTYAGRKPSV